MTSFLKHYKLTLTTVGPVFIGSGEKRTAKEYYRGDCGIYFPDMEKLYADMDAKGMASAFEQFMLGGSSASGGSGQQARAASRLNDWLRTQGWQEPDTKTWGGYGVRLGNLEASKARYNPNTGTATPGQVPPLNDVLTFIKDGYGNPYVPGSSIKGLIRTLVLEYLVAKCEKNGQVLISVPQHARDKRAALPLEARFLKKLARPGTKPDDAVNDLFRAVRVADSSSFTLRDLAVCQKIDVNTKDDPVGLPLFRECLKPQVSLSFDITVDTSLDAKASGISCTGDCERNWLLVDTSLDAKASGIPLYKLIENLSQIAGCVYGTRYWPFIFKFAPEELDGLEVHESGSYVYLGGGAGFRSKTVVNDQRVMSSILDRQFGKGGRPGGVPHSRKTQETGVSPLVLKLTKYRGRYYEMGKVKLSIEPVD